MVSSDTRHDDEYGSLYGARRVASSCQREVHQGTQGVNLFGFEEWNQLCTVMTSEIVALFKCLETLLHRYAVLGFAAILAIPPHKESAIHRGAARLPVRHDELAEPHKQCTMSKNKLF